MYIIRVDILKDGEICDNAYFDGIDWTYNVMKAKRFDNYNEANQITEKLNEQTKNSKWVHPRAIYETVEIDF